MTVKVRKHNNISYCITVQWNRECKCNESVYAIKHKAYSIRKNDKRVVTPLHSTYIYFIHTLVS